MLGIGRMDGPTLVWLGGAVLLLWAGKAVVGVFAVAPLISGVLQILGLVYLVQVLFPTAFKLGMPNLRIPYMTTNDPAE